MELSGTLHDPELNLSAPYTAPGDVDEHANSGASQPRLSAASRGGVRVGACGGVTRSIA